MNYLAEFFLNQVKLLAIFSLFYLVTDQLASILPRNWDMSEYSNFQVFGGRMNGGRMKTNLNVTEINLDVGMEDDLMMRNWMSAKLKPKIKADDMTVCVHPILNLTCHGRNLVYNGAVKYYFKNIGSWLKHFRPDDDLQNLFSVTTDVHRWMDDWTREWIPDQWTKEWIEYYTEVRKTYGWAIKRIDKIIDFCNWFTYTFTDIIINVNKWLPEPMIINVYFYIEYVNKAEVYLCSYTIGMFKFQLSYLSYKVIQLRMDPELVNSGTMVVVQMSSSKVMISATLDGVFQTLKVQGPWVDVGNAQLGVINIGLDENSESIQEH